MLNISDDILSQYAEVKLAANGLPHEDAAMFAGVHDLIEGYRERTRQLAGHLCPPDRRLQDFLDRHFADLEDGSPSPKMPEQNFMLDRPGLARFLSLPPGTNEYRTPLLTSYRVKQGILHNPKSDRRTTVGTFHVAEGGLPIPSDKKAVPKAVFANLFTAAVNPPDELSLLPYSAKRAEPAHCLVSLLLRPMVVPAIPATDARKAQPAKTMEIRLFAPGSLVSNLDFVESIFGNAGNPHLPDHDAGLDVLHWTGHSGAVILAPHLVHLTKKELGLPPRGRATERQRRDGMCWETEDEKYNEGTAFKVTCRDASGVIVTLIADNYFGYCKKEVKTQIGFAANLFGLAEEEHAGGALAFPSYALGDEFQAHPQGPGQDNGATFADVVRDYGDRMHVKPEGYAVDRTHGDILYVDEHSHFSIPDLSVRWPRGSGFAGIKLRGGHTYVLPSGYKVRLEKHPGAASWRLVGTVGEGTFCHKPCTVSGGGKSEISKSIRDVLIYGPLFVSDLGADMDEVAKLLGRDYRDRFQPAFMPDYGKTATRSILAMDRSLGSVIKLFTPSPTEFTDAYNAWTRTIPTRILTLLFAVKRFYKAEWGTDWRSHFSVDIVNGAPGHQLKVDDRGLAATYLRIGVRDDGSWRVYKLRQDFIAADKVQMEDDITASVTVPRGDLMDLGSQVGERLSVKVAQNCETRLFQRPDDAILRGHDKQAELDLAGGTSPSVFISNFEPLTPSQARDLTEDPIGLSQWTEPMRDLITRASLDPDGTFVVSSAHPRMVDGKPSKNPRYLQERPDLLDARGTYLAEVGARLKRRLPPDRPVVLAVSAVLPGRRNNPPDVKAKLRPLATHGPIHYQELPELFMEFASSLTGKSPSTTGAGSEGALTKGPFNALLAFADLDNALLSMILCGYGGFTTSAGCIGPKLEVGHDISLLIPEIWARIPTRQREPSWLIQEGHLEPLKDFEYQGRKILASRLGYRITERFVHTFFGKVFDNPAAVFDEAMLRPETQDLAVFVDGVENIVEAHRNCARQYLEDGADKHASPALLALLNIMATGSHEGHGIESPAVRRLFDRDLVIQSDWYRKRLSRKQAGDVSLWQRHVATLGAFVGNPHNAQVVERLGLGERLAAARATLGRVGSADYLGDLQGTIGRADI